MKKIKLSVAALLIASASFAQTNQCTATTKQNLQCKNTTKNISLLCGIHDPNHVSKADLVTVICSGTTKAGNNCKAKTKNASGLCHNHKEN
tara:strand:+ start:270 stop:542 length:273 start_codon:yes stop_codon:yes gene_type:complete